MIAAHIWLAHRDYREGDVLTYLYIAAAQYNKRNSNVAPHKLTVVNPKFRLAGKAVEHILPVLISPRLFTNFVYHIHNELFHVLNIVSVLMYGRQNINQRLWG